MADVHYMREVATRLVACLAMCLMTILVSAAQTGAKVRPILKRTVWIAAPPFIRIRVSPAKAAINSDWAIAEKLTGAWLPCQESSALQWPAQSNYRLKAEYGLGPLQNPRSDPIRELDCKALSRRALGTSGQTM
jgi:hypothetical protein